MIRTGARVLVTDAVGVEHDAVALSSIEGKSQGHSFPVIWIELANHPGGRIPWPVESVRLAVDAAEKEQS